MKFKAILLLVASACLSLAQTGLATITGTVTDQTGAVMAGVTVQATQVATGTVVAATTTDTGNYTLPQLRVGEYSVVVERNGFKTFRREGLTLAAAQTLRLDVALEVGATTESVTVTAEATLLKTDSGTLATNISPKEIQNLPLLPVGTFVRDPFALVNTVPGVIQNFVATRVNGLGQNTVQYRLDGEVLGQLNFPGITTRTQPSPDAVEEVAVQTSNISAEFGSASGAVFNVSIKSGTNKFHGTVYDYAVNEVLNAHSSTVHLRDRARRHDYGFNIGGPVKIPYLYDGTNKTFFFFNWEQYRDKQRISNFTAPTVPTEAYRNGDFSGLFAASGNANLRRGAADYIDPLGNTIRLGTIFDPASRRTVTCTQGDCTRGAQVDVRTAYAGNRVPTAQFDPVAAAVLTKYVPLPNISGALINNYLNPFGTSRVTDSPAVKVDQNLGSNGRMSFTWTKNKTVSPIQGLGLSEGFPNPITANSGTFESGEALRLNTDYTIRPTLNFHLGLGYSFFAFATEPVITDYDAVTDIGLRGATASKNFPQFTIGADTTPPVGGLQNLGTGGQTGFAERRPSVTTTLTWVRGNHTIKGGGDFRQDMLPNSGFGGANGSYNFTGNGITWQPSLIGVQGLTGNTNVGFTFANFLMGSVRTGTVSLPVNYRRSKRQWGAFVQDTWRARRNLTVDLGLRWDLGTYAREDYGRLGALSLTVPNTAAGLHPGGSIFEATCGCNFAQNYPFAIGPRVGAAYTINPKTVLRGGIGLAYGATVPVGGAPSNSASTLGVQLGEEAFRLKDGLPTYVQPRWPNFESGVGLNGVGNAPTLIDPNAGRPDRTIQWNMALQREITPNLVVEAAYVGNRNVWAPAAGFQDFNGVSEQLLAKYGFNVATAADAGLLTTTLANSNTSLLAQRGVVLPYAGYQTNQTVRQSIRPFPQYSGAISPSAPMGRSWYDSLQLTATKRFSHGLQASGYYTYSKNLQHVSSFDVFNRANGKDIVGGNPPQVLRIVFEYQVPKTPGNRIVSWAVRDWAVSASMFYQTAGYLGRPANNGTQPISQWLGRGPGGAQLKQNADGSYMNPWSVNWVDLDGQRRTDPLDINCRCFDPNTTQVLNPAVWENIPNGTWGAQTQLLPFFRGGRRPVENANLARNFRFGPDSRYNLQIRVEFQNIFNRRYTPGPVTGNATTPLSNLGINAATGLPYTDATGKVITAYTAGFGSFGNLGSGTPYGTPRTGQFIARFSF